MTASWLATFNDGADDGRLATALGECCSSSQWIDQILAGRPFADDEAVFTASDQAIADLDRSGLADALAGHPRIGERPSGPAGAAGSAGEWSRQEQAGVTSATPSVLEEIATANIEYEQKFGHVYLVCATGKSADELLAICRSRLANDPVVEEGVVCSELAKITRIRLGRLLRPYDAA
jgi:2-oxo-4-hydroxy-4-carboxy-5-ureidoimidazoline decarboxylase